MQAVIHHLIWNMSRDCSVYTTSEYGVLWRTTAQMFQRTWFLFCLSGIEGVKRTAKSSLPQVSRGRLDLDVLFTPSTLNRQNRKQVRWNICAGVVLRLPRWCRQNSHVTCPKKDGGSLPACAEIFCIAWFIPEYSKVPSFTCLGGWSGVHRVL